MSGTSDHKEKYTREKETAQLVNARSRLQFGVGDFQKLWELVATSRKCDIRWHSPSPSPRLRTKHDAHLAMSRTY